MSTPPISARETRAPSRRIGPNAVLQLTEALRSQGFGALLGPLFTRAGVAYWLKSPPDEMVDEHDVARLHQGVRRAFRPEDAEAVMAEAGRRTADYLLAKRIPKAAQTLLKLLPAGLAANLLVAAIKANAWTFAGSSQFEASRDKGVVFTIVHNPLCAGERAPEAVCDWHAAVFERLFQALVSPAARARETHCEAAGDDCCEFRIAWR